MTDTESLEKSRTHTVSNPEYNSQSAIAERIETEPILNRIELFLSGCEIKYEQDESGSWVMLKEQTEDPPMNAKGRFYIMAKLRSLMNRANVQGNFESGHYEEFMFDIHESIATTVMLNLDEWGVKSSDYDFLVDFVVQGVEPFFTRLKNDRERSHFDQTMKISETNTLKENNKHWWSRG